MTCSIDRFLILWAISSGLPIVRLRDIPSTKLSLTHIAVPLTGGSNPFSTATGQISRAESRAFIKSSQRVLDFYNIATGNAISPRRYLIITLIDHNDKRRLLYKDEYVTSLRSQYPDISIQLVDFASLPLIEQTRIANSTNLPAGVHGAGLTHKMFLGPNFAIIEILPPDLDHHSFDTMSKFLAMVRAMCRKITQATGSMMMSISTKTGLRDQ